MAVKPDFLNNDFSGSLGSLFNSLATQANQDLQSNSAYQNTLFKMQQSTNALADATSSLQTSLADSANQLSNASRTSRMKQAITGLGGTGLGVLNAGVNTQDNDTNIQRQLSKTSAANRSSLDSYHLYEDSARQALYEQMYKRTVNNRKQGLYGQSGGDYGWARDTYTYKNYPWSNKWDRWKTGDKSQNYFSENDYKDFEKYFAERAGGPTLDPVEQKDQDYWRKK